MLDYATRIIFRAYISGHIVQHVENMYKAATMFEKCPHIPSFTASGEEVRKYVQYRCRNASGT